MAAKYAIGDTIRLTRTVSVNHFAPHGYSIVGKIVEIKPKGTGHRELSAYGKGTRDYGITFPDRPGVWWYANWEFKRMKRG